MRRETISNDKEISAQDRASLGRWEKSWGTGRFEVQEEETFLGELLYDYASSSLFYRPAGGVPVELEKVYKDGWSVRLYPKGGGYLDLSGSEARSDASVRQILEWLAGNNKLLLHDSTNTPQRISMRAKQHCVDIVLIGTEHLRQAWVCCWSALGHFLASKLTKQNSPRFWTGYWGPLEAFFAAWSYHYERSKERQAHHWLLFLFELAAQLQIHSLAFFCFDRLNQEVPLIVEAAERNDVSLMRLLLGKCSRDYLRVDEHSSKYGSWTALNVASALGHTDIVSLLLADRETNPNIPNVYGDSPILSAVRQGQTGVVQLLAKAEGVDFSIKDKRGYNPLHRAIRGEEEAIVESLLQTDIDLRAQDSLGRDALSIAEMKGNDKITEKIARACSMEVVLGPAARHWVRMEEGCKHQSMATSIVGFRITSGDAVRKKRDELVLSETVARSRRKPSKTFAYCRTSCARW